MVIALSWFLAATAPSVITGVSAHAPGEPAPANWRPDNLQARDALEIRCGAELAARRRKRGLDVTDSVMSKRAPHKRHILPRAGKSNDSTCLITPEATQGPYHILGEIVRQNITEGQVGVPLEVSIDFVNVETCKPVQVWVDAWHANATGFYAGYIAETGGTGGGPGEGPPPGGGPSATSSSGASSTSLGVHSGADTMDAASKLNRPLDDNSTFLRGVFQSDEDGHLTMYSIFPGWYSGRAQHFHIKAFPQGFIASNGTFVSNSSAVHTGQFFFDNHTLNAVAATDIYAANAIDWADAVANEDDMWYPYQSAVGYNADMNITWVGDNIMDGLIGSITVGLNLSYSSLELSTHWVDFDVAGYAASSLLPSGSAPSTTASPDTGSAEPSSNAGRGLLSFGETTIYIVGMGVVAQFLA